MMTTNPACPLSLTWLFYLAAPVPLLVGCSEPPPDPRIVADEATVILSEGWMIARAGAGGSGAEISSPELDLAGWTPATVPTTVLAAQVAAGEIEEPYFGRNLETIPTEPYEGAWWYRTEFPLVADSTTTVRLILEGINYSANLWLNGQQVGAREELVIPRG